MHSLSNLILLGTAGLQSVLGAAVPQAICKRDIDSFIASEEPIALAGLLCNIGASGCEASGALPGIVVASPSKTDPDYWYTWTRDAALVFKGIIERFSVNYDAGLQTTIHEYISSQAFLQTVSNPSGVFADGSGLGEAKYHVDMSAYTGGWGRPQRDGPALRAIAIMGYAKWLVANGYPETASEIAWPVIRNDLAYVSQYWNQTGFDLWEEVSGSSFFTTASQYRALVEGSALAANLGTTCSACDAVAPDVLCFLQTFWSPSMGAMTANINENSGRAGLDANTLLASIHGYDPALGCDVLSFQPCSDKALSNHKAVIDSFRSWGINSGIPAGSAVAVGRYIEDVYYGGNPWYLNTCAAAEQLYDALQVWAEQGFLEITDISLGFFRDFDSSVSTGTYAAGSAVFENMVAAVFAYADGYLNMVQTYMGSDGHLAEQYEKSNGTPLGARDLTWSYAAFLTAVAAREGIQSNTFGWSTGAPAAPGTCGTNTVLGAYITATATVFPTNIVVGGGDETITTTAPEPTATACFTAVTFDALVSTVWGDTIKVVGSVPALGNWDPANGIPLAAGGYTDDYPLWSVTLNMSPGTYFEYKLVLVKEDGTVSWEADPNRNYGLPSECGSSVHTTSYWQY